MASLALEKSIFFDPTIARISDVVIDVTFVLSSALFPLMLWLIFRQSRTLGKYRWYMLVNVTLCYQFDFVLTLIKPVYLGPLFGWYLQGFLPVNGLSSMLLVGAWVVLLVGMDLSVVASLFYRWSQVSRKVAEILLGFRMGVVFGRGGNSSRSVITDHCRQ
jgi:hypothetical protein